MRVVVNENKIEGFTCVNGFRGEMSVITFLKNGDKWTTGSSMCLPADILAARQVHECVTAVFEALSCQ